MSDIQWNLVGYARVSTDDQNLDLQLNALRKHGVRELAIYREHVSGVARRRPELARCLDALRPGDVLVVWKLDRLGRDLGEIIAVSNRLREADIQLRSLTENLDTTTAYGKFFFHVIAAFAQLERDLISERTRAGIAAAKERGQVPGRRPALTPEQWAHAVDRLAFTPTLSIAEIIKDPAFQRLGWPGAKPPSRTTISTYRQRLIGGEAYPEDWIKYVQRSRSDN